MSLNWMRQNTVNILKYLPDFLQSDVNFKSVGDVCSAEHEEIRQQLQDIFLQFFVETATWGLSYYERILNLKPNTGDSYTQRRNRILLRLQANQTSTVSFMTTLAKRYFSTAAIVEIKEDNENYAFWIIADAVSYDIDGLIEAMNIYKPAHLACIIVHLLPATMSVYYGGVIQEYRKTEILPASNFSIEIADSALFSAGTAQTSGIIKIN